MISNHGFASLEAVGDGLGQDVEQESFGLLTLRLDLSEVLTFAVAKELLFEA